MPYAALLPSPSLQTAAARSAAGRGNLCVASVSSLSPLPQRESASIRGFAFYAAKLKVIFKDLSRICSIIVGILTPQECFAALLYLLLLLLSPFCYVCLLFIFSVLDSDYKLILIRVIYIAATYRSGRRYHLQRTLSRALSCLCHTPPQHSLPPRLLLSCSGTSLGLLGWVSSCACN